MDLQISFSLTGDTMEEYVFQVFIYGDTEKIVLRSSEDEKVIQYHFSKYEVEKVIVVVNSSF